MIHHSVIFRLKHAPGSQEEESFLRAAKHLAKIPTVKSFKCLRQVSKKTNYQFGLSMDFTDATDYQAYNAHPDHTAFVENRWMPEVIDYMEIDYEEIQ